MATSDADKVLCSTPGRANFQRISRLLVCGGTRLLREILDFIYPPSVLPTVLGDPVRVKQLKGARLTKPQRDCLYLSPGVYGKSTDFDITLLSSLLRTICNLTPPLTGWDSLPASSDHSLAADLVRIKLYRNSVYGHVKESMEVTDDEFSSLWQDISETITRIAGNISPVKRNEWKTAIDVFLNDSLTPEDERNVQELQMWYHYDMDVKKAMEQLEVSCEEGMSRVNTAVTREMKDVKEGMSQVETAVTGEMEGVREEIKGVKEGMSQVETAVTGEMEGVREEIKGVKEGMNQVETAVTREIKGVQEAVEGTSHNLETVVREEVHDIKDQLGQVQKSVDGLSSLAGSSQPLGAPRVKVRIDCETIGPPSAAMVVTTHGHHAGSYEAPPVPIVPGQCQVTVTESFQGENVSRQPFPSTQQILNRIAEMFLEERQKTDGFLEYMKQVREVMVVNIEQGSLLITVMCSSLEILEGLWEDYTSGHLKEMAQELLVTVEILKELAIGLTSVKLKVTIQKEEYEACKQYFLQSGSKPYKKIWHLGRKLVRDFSYAAHRQMCLLLAPPLPGRDWKTLAHKMGYTDREINYFACYDDLRAVEVLIKDYEENKKGTISELLSLLEDMERNDLIQDLHKYIEDMPTHKEIEKRQKWRWQQIVSKSYDVFISYAEADRDFAYEVVERLEGKPYYMKVCIPEHYFIPGVPFYEAVDTAIGTYNKKMVVILSENLNRSNSNLEVEYALASSGGENIVPILYKPCKMPSTLKFITYLDYTSVDTREYFWDRLAASLGYVKKSEREKSVAKKTPWGTLAERRGYVKKSEKEMIPFEISPLRRVATMLVNVTKSEREKSDAKKTPWGTLAERPGYVKKSEKEMIDSKITPSGTLAKRRGYVKKSETELKSDAKKTSAKKDDKTSNVTPR